jgi:hypothetical protein
MFDNDRKKSRKSRVSAKQRVSQLVDYIPPNVEQFKLQQPPAGGLQRKGTGRMDFDIRTLGNHKPLEHGHQPPKQQEPAKPVV